MPKYRKKPVVVDAIQLKHDNVVDVLRFLGNSFDGAVYTDSSKKEYAGLVIVTLEGNMIGSMGDYIIKGVKGEFYPCKPDIFEQTYELVE